MPSIFISLTKVDTPLANALRGALGDLLGEKVDVPYSTSKEIGKSPTAGSDWFRWIVDQVQNCDFALILLTPQSVQKPWVLWEAGAVYGAASASGEQFTRKVRPLLYQVGENQLPSPFRDSTTQYQLGDTKEEIEKVFGEILEEYVRRSPSPVSAERRRLAERQFDDIVARYLTSVREHLLQAAAVPTEVAVAEWLARLDTLVKDNRRSEVEYLQDWMEIAFGRSRRGARDYDDAPRTIDVRIHTRLADIYLKTQDYARAVDQLELARQLAPRDIYVLRTLGRAYLEAGDKDGAAKVIERIQTLDAKSLERNVECAALAARLNRETQKPSIAHDILEKALKNNRDSYYLANLLGETSLESNDAEAAHKAFREALAIVQRLRENNIWANATGANSAFVLGNMDQALEYARLIASAKPDADSLATVERGLRTLAPHLHDGERRLRLLIDELRPQSPSATTTAATITAAMTTAAMTATVTHRGVAGAT